MHSISSITPKSTPPPPRKRTHRHRHRHHDMSALRRDINPATYYDHRPTPQTPRQTRPISRSPQAVNASASYNNLLSHSASQTHSHSANNNKNHRIQSDGSASVMDLFSYTEQTMYAQRSNFSFLDSESFHVNDNYNEFSNHSEFIMNPNGSWSDLYAVAKAQTKSNKKQYKNRKIKSNITNYMKYMSLTATDGEDTDKETENDNEGSNNYEPNFEPQFALPPPTAFDSVDDIFNLLPNQSKPQNNNILQEIKEFSSGTATENISENHEQEDLEGNEENETINNSNDEQEETKQNEKQVFHKLRQILNEYDMDNLSDSDNDALFTKIDHLCQDLNVKKSKVEHIQTKYKDLEEFLNKLKSENETLKRKNDELANKLTLNSVTTENVLAQLNEFLTQAKSDLVQNNNNYKSINGAALFNDFKIKLKSTYESLTDLANDLNSETLKLAVAKVNKSIGDIEFLENHKLYRISNLENIINDLMKDINVNNTKETPGGGVNDENKYPQFIIDEKEKELLQLEEKELEMEQMKKSGNKLTKYGVFDDDFPIVLRIDIYGGWFNKKSRAVIKCKGQIFYRKEADFKWLYKMIQVDSENNNHVIPDFPKELPHVLWPNNYLSKRKSELNLFLMQCHSLRKVKKSNPWNIFLEENKKTWKEKRDIFDKVMLKKIKQNQH